MRKLALSINHNPWFSVTAFQILLAGIFFSRISEDSIYSNKNHLSTIFYFCSILIFLGIELVICLQRRKQDKLNGNLLFALLWFVIMAMASRGSVRYIFFFAPIAIAFGCYALIQLLRIILQTKSLSIFTIGRIHRIIVFIALSLILVLILNDYTKKSLVMSENIYPVDYEIQDYRALEWMKNGISNDSVVAAWWDFGSRINVVSDKSTVIDEDHYIPFWIHLMARHVFCGKTLVEALEFLKIHGVTHLMISLRDILDISTISWIGSDENFDRLSSLTRFSYNDTIPLADQKGFLIHLQPITVSPINEALITKYRYFAYGKWFISDIYTEFEKGDEEKIRNTFLVIKTQDGKLFRMKPGKLFFGNQVLSLDGEVTNGSLILIKDDKYIWSAIYVPDRLCNYLAIKLFLLNEENPYFKLVYPSKSKVIENIKIWKIEYPPHILTKYEYLNKRFTYYNLYRSWLRGDSIEIP